VLTAQDLLDKGISNTISNISAVFLLRDTTSRLQTIQAQMPHCRRPLIGMVMRLRGLLLNRQNGMRLPLCMGLVLPKEVLGPSLATLQQYNEATRDCQAQVAL
jgi:hypothetical protein